jgi:hypothetical protein
MELCKISKTLHEKGKGVAGQGKRVEWEIWDQGNLELDVWRGWLPTLTQQYDRLGALEAVNKHWPKQMAFGPGGEQLALKLEVTD